IFYLKLKISVFLREKAQKTLFTKADESFLRKGKRSSLFSVKKPLNEVSFYRMTEDNVARSSLVNGSRGKRTLPTGKSFISSAAFTGAGLGTANMASITGSNV